MSSPSTSIKVNYLILRYLHFEGVRGDLQEGHDYGKRLRGYDKLLHDYASRWQFLSSQCQFLPSRSPLTSSRAQNRHFWRFWPPKPSFSSLSSTKSRFLCFFGLRNPHFRAFRAQNRGFCALLPSRTLDFGLFEHKIGIFVLVKPGKQHWEA